MNEPFLEWTVRFGEIMLLAGLFRLAAVKTDNLLVDFLSVVMFVALGIQFTTPIHWLVGRLTVNTSSLPPWRQALRLILTIAAVAALLKVVIDATNQALNALMVADGLL